MTVGRKDCGTGSRPVRSPRPEWKAEGQRFSGMNKFFYIYRTFPFRAEELT